MDVHFKRAGLYLAITLTMAALVGVGGFAAGRGTAGTEAAFDDGYEAGAASASRAADDRYGTKGPGRAAIYGVAYARGRAHGRREGRRRGYAAGQRAGIRKGEQLAFAGFDGGWQVGAWYAVRIGHGEGALGYSIPSRVPLASSRAYRLCGGGVCSVRSGSRRQ